MKRAALVLLMLAGSASAGLMAQGRIELLDNAPASQEFVTNDGRNMGQPAPNTSNSDIFKQLGVPPAPRLELQTQDGNVRTQNLPGHREQPSR